MSARIQEKRIFAPLAMTALACVWASAALAQAPAVQLPPKVMDPVKSPPPQLPKTHLPAPIPAPAACADPALRRLTFKIVERSSASRLEGKVNLIATVENAGKGHYRSRPNQQVVELIETVPGRAPRTVASREFANLAPGEKFDLVWTRPWNASSPAEGEFPPSYEARLSYDPDIRIDGNPANDECNNTNNSARLNGKSINMAFRGS